MCQQQQLLFLLSFRLHERLSSSSFFYIKSGECQKKLKPEGNEDEKKKPSWAAPTIHGAHPSLIKIIRRKTIYRWTISRRVKNIIRATTKHVSIWRIVLLFSLSCPPPIHPNFNNRIGAAYSETKDTHIAVASKFHLFSTFFYTLHGDHYQIWNWDYIFLSLSHQFFHFSNY